MNIKNKFQQKIDEFYAFYALKRDFHILRKFEINRQIFGKQIQPFCDVTIHLSKADNPFELLVLTFERVTSLVAEGIDTVGGTDVSIYNYSNYQLEDIKFCVRDDETGSFEFFCKDFNFKMSNVQ